MYYYLDDESLVFPHPAEVKNSGILAVGGKLTVQSLKLAYAFGIFPWYNYRSEPVIWWCPLPRYVIFPAKVKISKSMRSYFNQQKYEVTFNQKFEQVLDSCRKTPRKGETGTWINPDIARSYYELHREGYAWSVEVWEGNNLVGGLYGVVLGKIFFGESMFSLKPNASKFGFITLARRLENEGFYCIDCQIYNSHLESLGGEFVSGEIFLTLLSRNRKNLILDSHFTF